MTPADLQSARQLLVEALPSDRVDVVAEEKLLGANGTHSGETVVAERDGALVGVMATAGRWIKILATAANARRRGVGSALLDHAAGRLPRPVRMRICDHPGNYLTPGLDTRLTDARAFFEHHGFRVTGQVENLRIPLKDNPLVTRARADELIARARSNGYEIRRATAEDKPALEPFISLRFAPVWTFEAHNASSLHLALFDGAPVAFAAADGNNRGLGWFGPAGTLPDHRGKRLGEALLLQCLLDVAHLPEGGVVAWIGPKKFYERAASAVTDRMFWTMERELL